MRDPNNIPIGKIENRAPDEISSRLNFIFSPGAIEPRVMRPIPNKNIPRQAAKKTRFLLYMNYTDYCDVILLSAKKAAPYKPASAPSLELSIETC